jgi:hypothetical protein
MLLAFIAFVFIFAVLQRSPWAQENVYERITTFRSGKGQGLEIPGLNNERLQEHLADGADDAWKHAVPSGGKTETSVAGVEEHRPSATLESARPTEVKDNVSTPTFHESTPAKAHPPWVTDPARTKPLPAPVSRPTNFKQYMQSMLKWDRPTWDGHWPPFSDYINQAYDPNRWERFDMLVFGLFTNKCEY